MSRASQKMIDVAGVRVGGEPGLRPTVLVGSIFYRGHRIVKDEKRGEFDKIEAKKLLAFQDEMSERTGNPCIVDVVAPTAEALVKEVEFVAGATKVPIFFDGVTPQVRVEALPKVADLGIMERIIYNSLSPDFKPEEIDAMITHGVKNTVLLAYNPRDFTARGRVTCIWDGLARLTQAGIENVLVDTCVLDIPSLGSACRAIEQVKAELGSPSGCGAHNAIGTWKGLKTKMPPRAAAPSSAVATALAVAAGADFVLYGPLAEAEFVFPSTALANTVAARAEIEAGRRPDRSHPMYRIA